MSILSTCLQAIPPGQAIQVAGCDFLFSGLIKDHDERWLIMSDGGGMYLVAVDEIVTIEWYPENAVTIVDPGMN